MSRELIVLADKRLCVCASVRVCICAGEQYTCNIDCSVEIAGHYSFDLRKGGNFNHLTNKSCQKVTTGQFQFFGPVRDNGQLRLVPGHLARTVRDSKNIAPRYHWKTAT